MRNKKNNLRNLILGVIAFAIVFFVVSISTSLRQEIKASDVTINTSETDYIFGDPSAPITLVEFGDYECPACKAYKSFVDQIVTNNPGKVKFVYKQFPLIQIHRNALLGAKAVLSAGEQGKYFEMHNILYDNQDEWSKALNAKEKILGYATGLGLDMAKFEASMNSSAIEDRIRSEMRMGTTLGITGTPTFYANGVKIDGATSYQDFEAKVLATEIKIQN